MTWKSSPPISISRPYSRTSTCVRFFLAAFILLTISCIIFARRGPHRPWTAFPPLIVDPLSLELGHPTFPEIRFHERSLPQHVKPSLFVKVSSDRPRYLYFPRRTIGGWNNHLQELLLNTHLAYLSQRAYVFSDYVPGEHPPFPDELPHGRRHKLRVPINAFISGPTAGGALSTDGTDSLARRAVSEEWWDIVCPPSERVSINYHEAMREMGLHEGSEAHDIMFVLARKLLDLSAPCVRIDGGFSWDFNHETIISLWPSYSASPALTGFAWSPLITAALFRNHHLFTSNSNQPPPSLTPITAKPYHFRSFSSYHASTPPIEGLLGIHIRRGDFSGHCPYLAHDELEYNAWNQLGTPGIASRPTMYNSTPTQYFSWPVLPDYLDVPEGQSRADATLAHCWPTTDAMRWRINSIRDEAASGRSFPRQDLRRVYIATDGTPEWVKSLSALLSADGWEVSSSLDMDLMFEEYAVSQAVDMAVLTAAESFIGSGFSSLTSNVVQIRLGAGRPPGTIHFW